VNNPIDLRVTHGLELLNKFKMTVADFTKREETLLREIRNRGYQLNRKHHEASQALETSIAGRVSAIEGEFGETAGKVRSAYEKRRAWIERAHLTLEKTLPNRAQAARGALVGKLQMDKMAAERRLASDLHAADSDFAEFAARLEEQRTILGGLRRRASQCFAGYGAFGKLLEPKKDAQAPEKRSHPVLFIQMEQHISKANEAIREFRSFPLPKLFAIFQLPLVLPFVAFGTAAAAYLMGPANYPLSIGGGIALIAILIGLHATGKKKSASCAETIGRELFEAAQTHDAAAAAATEHHSGERKRAEEAFEATKAEIESQWGKAGEIQTSFEKKGAAKYATQLPRALEKNKALMQPRFAAVEAARDAKLATVSAESDKLRASMDAEHAAERDKAAAQDKVQWDALVAEWDKAIKPLYAEVAEIAGATAKYFPAWNAPYVDAWQPPREFVPVARFGRIETDLKALAGGIPTQLSLPEAPHFRLPLCLTFPEQGSLLFESKESGGSALIGGLNNIILRLLATLPPGKVACTIIDPVGLGQNFAGLMHIADHEESVINRRIWTQTEHIEERLTELNEHIEKVIQMYLRDEFKTITEYNAHAGVVAEKYQFLVVADFPAGFNESAIKRLQSIAMSGPRCGVFTLIHWDQRHPNPDGFVPEDLRKASIVIRGGQAGFALDKQPAAGAVLALDVPPDAELSAQLVHKIGKASVDSNRVEVPFSQITVAAEERWKADTTSELRVAIGRTGATKLQYLAIGKGTRQHALFAGKTGSGKSTLFHVIITNLALTCSPEQVEFYLIDFKKGVEFKCYANKRLPHARVIAIESDREFGLSVLQRVDEELKRRGDMFRELGVQDIAGYKRAGGKEPVPRSLLLIDEFQEFFTEDDEVAQQASLLFDRIVRQGRAFGIHVLLGSQTLGGAFTLARATMGQMVIRVALQCNEADAYLIMDDNNPAPRLLSRPGEGIYNDAAGALEGNSPFQVVWLPDEERDELLDSVAALAPASYDGPIVFEGNAPANIRENHELARALAAKPSQAPSAARIWLGAPNSIKGPTEAVFQKQSGNHLLIVGQREESATTMLGLAVIALAAQFPSGGVKIVLIQASAEDSSEAKFFATIAAKVPGLIVADTHSLAEVMNDIAGDLKSRIAGDSAPDAPRIFLLVHGLQKFKKLRGEDDFSFSTDDSESPAKQLTSVITEGSSHGVHLITTVDSFNNVNRFINRKTLTEIEMRVVFQMSASDSASLIDSPKASNLGLHRALLHNEQAGTLETFRPYAVPDAAWIADLA
jgi:hypothetical protein